MPPTQEAVEPERCTDLRARPVQHVVGSVLSKPTPESIRAEWDHRITHERHYVAPVADKTISFT